ncbi:MAG: hypothetical protein N2255_08985 [Kiritimatiellae bacterium]|nr:hypothetical protein [Kiritimatiellia bacterium]
MAYGSDAVFVTVKKAISATNWLMGAAFREEAEEIAEVANVPVEAVVTLNAVYALWTIGCSTFISDTRGANVGS